MENQIRAFMSHHLHEAAMSKEASDFISKKISLLVKEGHPQDQAIAMAYEYARKHGYDVPENPNK